MTEQESLIEEEQELEDEVDRLDDEIARVGEETVEWYVLFDELTSKENQLAYVRACLRDFTDE